MPRIHIKSDEAYRMACELAPLTGENLTAAAVTVAIAERLNQEKRRRVKTREGVADKLTAFAEKYREAPLQDGRSPEDILYARSGLPKSGRGQ